MTTRCATPDGAIYERLQSGDCSQAYAPDRSSSPPPQQTEGRSDGCVDGFARLARIVAQGGLRSHAVAVRANESCSLSVQVRRNRLGGYAGNQFMTTTETDPTGAAGVAGREARAPLRKLFRLASDRSREHFPCLCKRVRVRLWPWA